MNGPCILRERPVQIPKKGLRFHNALHKTQARKHFRFHIANLSDEPVNLPTFYAEGILEPSEGLVKELPPGVEQPPGEGSDRVAAVGSQGARQRNTQAPPRGQDPARTAGKEPAKDGHPFRGWRTSASPNTSTRRSRPSWRTTRICGPASWARWKSPLTA